MQINTYTLGGVEVDSIELKCLVVSRGVKVDKQVYKKYGENSRLSPNPLECNCMLLSDGTIVQLTDMGFHLQYLTGILSFSNLKLLRYASQLGTPFTVSLVDDKAALLYEGEPVDFIRFPAKTDFYKQKTASGRRFVGNSVLQGLDIVAFQCLWACEFAAAGKACEFCFSGGEFETLAKKGKPLPEPLPAQDMAEIVDYAIRKVYMSSVQITGGSTYNSAKEADTIRAYLRAMDEKTGIKNIPCDILLYITPPDDLSIIREYFALGADKIACSLEVWDEERAKIITPGKYFETGRERSLKTLTAIAQEHGANKAFSNFIIGIEPVETLLEGARTLAERGVIPTASVWMPMGRPVMGTMKAPEIDFFRRAKEGFAELYVKYGLEPSGCRGLNVCIERDIWRYARGTM